MLNYYLLSQEQYVDFVVNLISSAEQHDATVQNKGDGQRTIGYGYTFGRNNNLSLWQAAGISLTPAEVSLLQSVDAAQTLAQKNALAEQFTRSISKDEATALLHQTYPQYEGPANQLEMPLSAERVAFVSLTYNRGAGTVNARMQSFFAAIREQDRAEAWFQIRYNAWGTNIANEAGLRARRLVEAQVFGLYDNVTNISPEEAKQAFRMWTRHEAQIRRDESNWGVNPDGTPGTRNLIAEVNSDARWATLPRVRAVAEAFTSAANVLVSQFGQGIAIDWQNILVGEDQTTAYYRNTDTDLLTGSSQNDLIFGESGNDILDGGQGQDVLYGGTGQDIYRIRPGDGNDIIVDYAGGPNATYGDGKGAIVYDPDGIAQGLAVGLRKPDDPVGEWKSADGSVTYTIDGSDLTIQTPTGTLTVKDFNQDAQDLGIRRAA